MASAAPTSAQADAAAAALAGAGSAADLARIEALAEALYAAHEAGQRAAAEAQLLPLARCSTAVLPQCTWVLDNSGNAYAQKFAAWTLTKVVTANWGHVTAGERVQLRNYVLQYLANKGVALQAFVRLELSTLLCRVTKLGWNDGGAEAPHRKIVEELSSFLDASEEHCVIGLQVMVRLVAEMNTTTPTTRRSFTQSQSRKVTLSFRDLLLLPIFNISLATLAKLAPPPAHTRLRLDALNLALACLSYDFVGSSLDDSNEDIGTIHIPIAWHTVIETPTTVALFMDTYAATCTVDTNQSKTCLECLVQLASMRRTLFSTEELRLANISRHMTATLDILRSRRGLDDHQNYHHFCRWLARLKVNYQLDELISLEVYPTWIDLVSQFTLHSLASDWTWVGDSLHYLLSLWSRLIGAKPYLKGGKKAYLDDSVVKIVETYVTSRLMAISNVDDNADDPDDDDVPEHLEVIPLLFRLQYDRSAAFMAQLMDQRVENYKTFASSGGVGADPMQVSRLERELAWLTRVIGAVVSGRLNASSTETQEITDGELSSRVYQVMIYTVDADRNAMLHRQQQQGGAMMGPGVGATKPGTLSPSVHAATPQARARNTNGALALDEAIIEFSQAFRRTYIGEEAVATSKVYVRLAERLGMNDHMIVLDVIASKIAYNLRNYGVVDGERIVSKSLTLLSDLAAGYSSSRLLCKLSTVREMIANHDEASFPFMKGADSKMGRHRTMFYTTLLRILFASGGAEFDSELEFTRFMEPMRQKLTVLAAMPSKEAFLADPTVKQAVIGVLRDLRGVVATMSNRKSYSLFFDWIYPVHTPVLLRICEVFSEAGAPEVTTPLLKLYAEFVNNKSQRIVFDSSSPNGILLFRETSSILVTYGKYTVLNWNRLGANIAKVADPYRALYKGIWVCMSMFARALAGNYVNFGVFSLYGDPALSDAMAVCFQLQAIIPVEELLAYPKVAKAYFGLIEILCTNHPKDIAELDYPMFQRVIQSLQEGLQSPEVWMSSQSAAAIDHLSAFRFRQTLKDTRHGRLMRAHVEQSPDMFANCLKIIFAMICHVDCTNQWSLSRPLLSLILTNEEAFVQLKAQTIRSQATPERQAAVGLAFDKLMKDIQPNIESKNRDRFTQQATHFRVELRES